MKYTIREKLAALREKLSARKAGTRLLALLLTLVLLQGDLMLSAYSAGGEGENGETSAQTSAPETTVPTTPEQTEAESKLPVDEDTLVITLDGAETTAVSLLPYEKAELKAEGLESDAEYQWQIRHPATGTWINIYDATEQCISVSSALVKNMLTKDGTAALRCYAHAENADYVTSFVTVTTVEESVAPVTPVSSSAFTTSGGAVTLADKPPEFVTVTIEYVRYDFQKDTKGNLIYTDVDGDGMYSEGDTLTYNEGVQAFSPYMATLVYDHPLNTTVEFPTLVGYDSYFKGEKTNTITIELPAVTANTVYTVEYRPKMVDFKIRYFFQNIYDDLYVEDYSKQYDGLVSEGKGAYTGAVPYTELLEKEFDGFTALYHQPDTIAADGSTIFEVYYERNYYLMEFDCNGGYGTNTLYNRYGSFVSVPNPVQMGHVFGKNGDGNGWDLVKTENPANTEPLGSPILDGSGNPTGLYTGDGNGNTLPTTMPTYNSAYKAIWDEIETAYSVVYWAESKTGTTTYLGSRLVEAMSGSTVHGSNDLTASMNICGQTAHTHGTGCTFICDLSEHAHGVGCICSIPIHTHSAACCTLHDHTASGCTCTRTHTEHDEDCCTVDVHTHSTACYTLSPGTWGNAYNGTPSGTTAANGIMRVESGWNNYYYYKIGDTWYQITGLSNWNWTDNYYANVTFTQSQTCKNGHTHGDGNCTCGAALHVHGDGTCTYSCGIVSNHTHDGVSCDYCDLAEHASHDSSCCSLTAHSHGAQCYSCGLVEHTHTDDCKEDELSFMVFDRADQNVTVKGDGSSVVNVYYKWKIFEIRFVFARSYVNNGNTVYQIADSTGNGNVYGGWTPVNVASLPTVDPKYESKSENYNGYTAHYIAVRAEYGANIESMWPSKAIHDVYDTTNNRYLRRFGSWGAEEGTPYRIDGGTKHANIVGPYPYMSKEMIKPANLNTPITDANGEVYYIAQRMSAWWGDDGTIGDWHGPINAHSYHIYVEAIDGSGDRTYNGKEYDLLTTHYFDCAHNNDTRVDPFDYTGLVCINDTRGADRSNLDKETDYQKNSSNYRNTTENINDGRYNCPLSDKCTYCNCFYYDRNIHQLSFVNYNSDSKVPDPQKLMYGTSLSNPGTPEYPEGIEPNAYEFKGWYTTPEWYTGTKVNWTALTMPDGDLTLYAKWTPIIRNVIFYSAYSDIAADTNDTTDKVYHFMKADSVAHGTTLGSTYLDTPEHPDDLDPTINGGAQAETYDFVGWFYMDESNKKRFAPDSMKVTRNLVLFAEWQTNVDTTYEVKYVLQSAITDPNYTTDHTTHEAGAAVSDLLFAHASVGQTKTFEALAGTALLPSFRKNFFPTVNSHSILMENDSNLNKYTFEYVYDDRVYYEIRYLEEGTGKVLATSKVTFSEDEAIITEKFKPIDGYIPTSFYLTKTLQYDGDATAPISANIFTFYYVLDSKHGLYTVEYYTENADSKDNTDLNNYTRTEYTVGTGDVGHTIPGDKRDYVGFECVPSMHTVISYKANGDVDQTLVGSDKTGDPPQGLVTNAGLVIRLYYKRIPYAYKIICREYETEKILTTTIMPVTGADTKDPSYRFESEVSETADDTLVYNGQTYYLHVTAEKPKTQSLEIRTETNNADPTANVITFYYALRNYTVNYKAICSVPGVPDFGIVSPNYQQGTAINKISGAVAVPGAGFRFVEWQRVTNEDVIVDGVHTQREEITDAGWVNDTKLTPKDFEDDLNDDGVITYYALFEPVTTSLHLTKTVSDLPAGMANDDTFLFLIEGQGKHTYLKMTVAVPAGGTVTIAEIPIDEYKITELTAWSWEYSKPTSITANAVKEDSTTVDLPNAAITFTIVEQDTHQKKNNIQFTNQYVKPDWLGGESAVVDKNFN